MSRGDERIHRLSSPKRRLRETALPSFERYARGEIDTEEYHNRIDALR
jgi:uncharacterized membrane protein